jgi:hypothetical protein
MKGTTLTTARFPWAGVVSTTIKNNLVFTLNRKEKPMNRLRHLFFNLIGLTLVMQLAFGAQAFAALSPTGAQNSQEAERARLRRVMDPATDIEEFRRELSDYLTELEGAIRLFNEVAAVRQKFDQAGLRPLALLAEAKQRLPELKPEELSLMRAIYARFPDWRATPRAINSLVKPGLRQMVESRVAARLDSKNSVIAGLVPDNCADGLAADVTNTDISIAAAILIVAEDVMEVFPTDGLTIAARIPAIVAVTIAKGALLALETLKNIKDDCNGATFEKAIQTQITNSTGTIVDNANANRTAIVDNNSSNVTTILNNNNANATAIVNNDNNNRTLIIDNANANKNELRDLILRTQIEADLAEADSATMVAWYLTPTANGGRLDLVQTIVTQTLANILAAGGSIGEAQSFLDQANADKAAGRFKDAYKNYRKAYKLAAN